MAECLEACAACWKATSRRYVWSSQACLQEARSHWQRASQATCGWNASLLEQAQSASALDCFVLLPSKIAGWEPLARPFERIQLLMLPVGSAQGLWEQLNFPAEKKKASRARMQSFGHALWL